MKQYHDILMRILHEGVRKDDRTGTGTLSVFGHQMRFDLSKGFPLVTTKRVFWRGVVEELLWMLRGETNVRSLQEKGVTIWDEWADENGNLGPVYGKQWRSWLTPHLKDCGKDGEGWTVMQHATIDQIANVIEQLRTNPDSRRLIVTAWNPADVDSMKLPPCHCFFQFNTRPMSVEQRLASLRARHEHLELEDIVPGLWKMTICEGLEALTAQMNAEGVPTRYLDCQLYQRSADSFLGVPFNIASYALLTHMIAREVGMQPGEFIHTLGDAHLYLNHLEQAREQLSREPRPLPTLSFRGGAGSIFNMTFEDLVLDGYRPHPPIAAQVAV